VCVDNREALLCEHRAIRQTQPVYIAFLGSSPRPQIPNCGWQRLKSVHALGAEKMQLFVFVGAPDLITHLGLRTPQGSHDGRMANVIVMRDLAQAFSVLANHTGGFAHLVRCQLRLGSELYAVLLGGSSPAVRACQDASSLVLG